MKLTTCIERWPLAAPFRITGRTFEHIDVLVVLLHDGRVVGRGEAAGVYYRNESPESMAAQIEAARTRIESVTDGDALLRVLPAGGARNAVDCALWELQARRSGRPVWELVGLSPPRPLLTTWTLGAGQPQAMAESARRCRSARALKLKLTGEPADVERVRAVRDARPDVWLAVDVNQGCTPRTFDLLLPALIEARVELIEQPFPVELAVPLEELGSPIPIAADESAQVREDVARLLGRFDCVNIKLDKCGGLTAALAMAREARRLGLKVMVGNMVGTSLAMAPAFITGQLCDVVDLDGPLLLAQDRLPAASYERGHIWCAPEVWGGTSEPRVIESVH
jgi:L-alanine-DL-glutamate epimerase-like enolase superfamily enzyme